MLTKINLRLSATAMLWDQNQHRAYRIGSQIIVPTKVFHAIHNFDEPKSAIQSSFGVWLREPPTIQWDRDLLIAEIPIRIQLDQLNGLFDEIQLFANSFQDGATDGYLEGDAVMYQTGETKYELIFENIQIETIYLQKTLDTITFPHYWIIKN